MQLASRKKHLISVRNGRKSSRFIIDLNRENEFAAESDRLLPFKDFFYQNEGSFSKRIPKSQKHGKSARMSDQQIGPEGSFLKEAAFSLTLVGLGFLAIWFLRKSFHHIFKLSYRVGWIAVFFLRFVYFFLKKIIDASAEWYLNCPANLSEPTPQEGSPHEKVSGYPKRDYGKLGFSYWTRTAYQYFIILPLSIFTYTFKYARPAKQKIGFTKPDKDMIRRTAIFGILLVSLSLPFKTINYFRKLDIEHLQGIVLGASESAFDNFSQAGDAMAHFDFTRAEKHFIDASRNLMDAQKTMDSVSGALFALASTIPEERVQMASEGREMMEAAQQAALLGKNLSRIMESLFPSMNVAKDGAIPAPKIDAAVSGAVFAFSSNSKEVGESIINLNKALGRISAKNFPAEYRESFIAAREKARELEDIFFDFSELIDEAAKVLGVYEDKRYLFIFQNNAEMRGSGGFVGSYALMDFSHGKIENLEAPGGGSYDTEAGMREKIEAPEPLHLVRRQWYFWDANWWPDWPTSARKLMWFYEKSDGPTVDGVIAFTPSFIEDILRVIGPIDMTAEYGVIIDADNFWLTTQTFAEQKQHITLKPKKIIGDLTEKMMREMPKRINKDNVDDFIRVLSLSLESKQVMMYFTDKDLQDRVEEYNWSGSLKSTDRDYLMVANTNIGGGKSDRAIRETISHKAEITESGEVYDTVRIERKHASDSGEAFVGVRNIDWMRIYVPEGSELLKAEGFIAIDSSLIEAPLTGIKKDSDIEKTENMARVHIESNTKIYNESGKTVFANWSQVDPGRTAVITLRYKLPFRLEKKSPADDWISKLTAKFNPGQKNIYPYSLMIQKQPGSMHTAVNSTLALKGHEVLWKYPEMLKVDKNGWFESDELDNDKYWAVLLEGSGGQNPGTR